jgi:hypothetical protein
MFSTKDSVEDLYRSRKRAQPVSSSSSKTPMEELKQMAKKRRASVVENEMEQQPRRKRKVQFVMEKNSTHIRSYTEDDLMNAWNSRAEAALVKLGAQLTVETYKQGAMNDVSDCIRGLEVHADPVRSEKKLLRSQNFTLRIIEQQYFLKAMMGKANEQIIAKMSSVLSADDVREARDSGSRDTNAALLIHAFDNAAQGKSSTMAGLNEEFAQLLGLRNSLVLSNQQ